MDMFHHLIMVVALGTSKEPDRLRASMLTTVATPIATTGACTNASLSTLPVIADPAAGLNPGIADLDHPVDPFDGTGRQRRRSRSQSPV